MSEYTSTKSGHPAAAYSPSALQTESAPTGNSGNAQDHSLVSRVFEYYQDTLASNPRPRAFLKKLGAWDTELLRQWGVGFSDRTLGKQIPDGDTLEGAWLRGNLQRRGLLVPSGGEFFRGALTFPLMNRDGAIVQAYGERITDKLRAGTSYHLYWSLQPAGLFNQQTLGSHSDIVLCKNPLEGLLLSSLGMSNVVATLGLRGFDEDQLDLLLSNGVQRVTLTFESTRAGSCVSRLVAQAISAYGIGCYRIPLPRGTSLIGYMRKYGRGALKTLLTTRKRCVQVYESMCRDSTR